MVLSLLRLSSFRNIAQAELELDRCNLIVGENGSGKTSLLESIYYLSLAKSFRTHQHKALIQQDKQDCTVFAETLKGHPLAIRREYNGQLTIRIQGEPAHSVSQLAYQIPVQLIHSQSGDLIELGPGIRRQFIDWALFYAHNEFLPTWKQYQHCLKQRNALLKKGQLQQTAYWDPLLIDAAKAMTAYRVNATNAIYQQLADHLPELLEISDFLLSYHQGWPQKLTYEEALASSTERDLALGYTQYGPHRADLLFTTNGRPVKESTSRGQQKMLAIALIIARTQWLNSLKTLETVYLVDDLAAELDATHCEKVMTQLQLGNSQIVMTAITANALPDILSDVTMFHVKQGEFSC